MRKRKKSLRLRSASRADADDAEARRRGVMMIAVVRARAPPILSERVPPSGRMSEPMRAPRKAQLYVCGASGFLQSFMVASSAYFAAHSTAG